MSDVPRHIYRLRVKKGWSHEKATTTPVRKRRPNGSPPSRCTVEGCVRNVVARNVCMGHWQRLKKWGDVCADVPLTKSHSGSTNNNWKGGQVTHPDGRVLIYSPEHPHPNWNGTHVYRYRLVMEKHLGRFLEPTELVHHKNAIVSDDRIENLELMSGRSEHAKKHRRPYTRRFVSV